MKIDISEWKEFKISDLFITNKINNKLHVPTGSMVERGSLREGNTPRVTVSNMNNGISGYYADMDNSNYRVYENFISVSFLGTVFYQPIKTSLDMKVHCLQLKETELTPNIALFLVSVIRQAIKKYAYKDQLSSTVLPTIKIYLPVNTNLQPNYDYMEKYFFNISKKVNNSIKILESAINIHFQTININNWKKFHLYDENLFEIDSGSKLDKAKMTSNNPSVLFIGRSSNNNGITTIVDKIKGIEPYTAGNLTLSLGGEYLGSCFVQEDYFYTSQNVVVLKPRKQISFLAKKFIATLIFKETQLKYKAFIDELNRHIKTDFSFYLPCNNDGTPDFEYMEKYMINLQNKVDRKLNILSDIFK